MSVFKKIRIGTDIKVQWPITTNGDVQSLDKRDLTLELVHIFGRKKVDFYTIGNTIIFNFRGVDQTNIGSYTFTLWENLGKNGQTVVDSCDAFELVLHSCMESEDATSGLGLEQVILSPSNIIVGVTGASAYEIWLELGNVGTQEDFINWLRQPAVDAASKAKDAASAALAAAGRADSATETAMATNTAVQRAEQLRVAAEQERVSAESQRTKAEQVRTTAESGRDKAEQARVTAESQRTKAEQQRGTAESERAAAETDRTNAESKRELSETERKQAEETRIASEQTRTTAESSRVKAEESRQTAEKTRTEAETKRQQDTAAAIKNAETATQEATKAAELANSVATPSGDPMHYMFEAAGAKWNAASRLWELNGLTDITNEQMRVCYNESQLLLPSSMKSATMRTNFVKSKSTAGYTYRFDLIMTFWFSEIEVANVSDITAERLQYAFFQAKNLKIIQGIINVSYLNNMTDAFYNCRSLVDVRLKFLVCDVSFSTSPLLSIDSILYLITNSGNRSITITLHPDAYDRAMSDSSITAALAAKPLITIAK